jgi:hypothetical protein
MARDMGPNVVLTSIGSGWRIPCVFTMIEFLDITLVLVARYCPMGPQHPRVKVPSDCTLVDIVTEARCGFTPLPPSFDNSQGGGKVADVSMLTRTQKAVLVNYLPWILSDQRALDAFRTGVPEDALRALREKAAHIAADEGEAEYERAPHRS